jgi:hypothetical protein
MVASIPRIFSALKSLHSLNFGLLVYFQMLELCRTFKGLIRYLYAVLAVLLSCLLAK